jgi:uncharacterized cofD-like protein
VGQPIRRVMLDPPRVKPLPRALEAMSRADLVIIGPGSLYTSIIPNLLIDGVPETIAASGARVVLVGNLMTEPGETDGYTAAQHVLAIRRHVPCLPIHDVLYNTEAILPEIAARYAETGATPVEPGECARLGCRAVGRPLLLRGHKVRHNPRLLARALLELVRNEGESSHD